MWDIKAIRAIFVMGLDFHTDKLSGSKVFYKIYNKTNLYLGFEGKGKAWYKIGSGYAISNGPGTGTPIKQVNFSPVSITAPLSDVVKVAVVVYAATVAVFFLVMVLMLVL